MNPFERRVIHSALTSNTEVKTASEGKEPNRYISIIPNNMKPGRPIREDRRRDNRNGDRHQNGRNDRRGGRTSGFSSMAKPARKSGFGGTYLGNSLKDNSEN